MISRQNQKHLIAHGLMPRMISLGRGLHFGGGAVRGLADHLAPPPPPGAATDCGHGAALRAAHRGHSGKTVSSESSLARAASWSWSPDTGRAVDSGLWRRLVESSLASPVGDLSLLKAPTSDITFKTLLRQ